jgi:hypothetical protein
MKLGKELVLGATLVFTQELAQAIMDNLKHQPYDDVAPIIMELQKQVANQPASSSPSAAGPSILQPRVPPPPPPEAAPGPHVPPPIEAPGKPLPGQ